MTTEVSEGRKRRSGRIPRELPIQVSGIDVQGRDFATSARTMLLSRYGAQILLRSELVPEQEISISLLGSNQDWDARVVCMCGKRDDGFAYGIEFLFQDGNFWGISFPGMVEIADKPDTAMNSLAASSTAKTASSEAAKAAASKARAAGEADLEADLERLLRPMRNKPGKHYALRLKCPHPDAHLNEQDASHWLLLQNVTEPLKKVLETPWDFECPMHGAQREYPLEARENHGGIEFVFDGRNNEKAEPFSDRSGGSPKHKPQAVLSKPRGRRESRSQQVVRVWVRGLDLNGNPFRQSAYSIDISRNGACLEGPGLAMLPGTTIEVSRRWRKALFRVVWIGRKGTTQASQIGIHCLEPGKNLWGIPEKN